MQSKLTTADFTYLHASRRGFQFREAVTQLSIVASNTSIIVLGTLFGIANIIYG